MGGSESKDNTAEILAESNRANAEANARRDEKMMYMQQTLMKEQKDAMQGKFYCVQTINNFFSQLPMIGTWK